MSEPNTSCTITNNSGGPIVVLNAYNSSTNVASNSPKQGYMQELNALPSMAAPTPCSPTGRPAR